MNVSVVHRVLKLLNVYAPDTFDLEMAATVVSEAARPLRDSDDRAVERLAMTLAESNKDTLYGGLVWEHMAEDDAAADYENKNYWRALARVAFDFVSLQDSEV